MKDEGGRKMVRKPKSAVDKGLQVFTGKCDVRLTTEQDNALSRLAERNGVSRSDVMRRAFSDFLKFNEE